MSQVLLGFLRMRKELFFRLKPWPMHAAPAAPQLYRVTQMKHLVVDEVFNRVAGNAGAIKDAADHNGVVGRIVVSETLARVIGAPGHLRTRHQAVEKPGIQVVENDLQVVVDASGSMNFLAPAHLPDQMGLGRDALASSKLAEARRMAVLDLLA